MTLLDGKLTSSKVKAEIAAKIASDVAGGKRAPGLAVILVGENPASQVYVRNKIKDCEEIGIISKPFSSTYFFTRSKFSLPSGKSILLATTSCLRRASLSLYSFSSKLIFSKSSIGSRPSVPETSSTCKSTFVRSTWRKKSYPRPTP